MAECEVDIRNAAETVNTCPADTDLMLFVSQSGLSVFRTWAKVKDCLGVSYKYTSFNIKVDGQPGSPVEGSTEYQDDRLKGATDLAFIVVGGFVEQGDFYFTLDNVTGTITRTNQWARNDVGTLSFNQLI
jgi:hypothetical protein